MKVNALFESNTGMELTKDISFDDLSSLHIAAIRAIADNRMDYDNMSDRMMDVVSELQAYGLVDDTYNLTGAGNKALTIYHMVGGGAERRRAAAQKHVDVDDIYNTDYGPNDLEDESPYQMNKTGTLNPHV